MEGGKVQTERQGQASRTILVDKGEFIMNQFVIFLLCYYVGYPEKGETSFSRLVFYPKN
jgi:hypothetical protein